MLLVKDVSITYSSPNGEVNAVDHITFQQEKSDFLCIIGPSGCGKSTLLSCIAGLTTPSQGSITYNDSTIGYMLQKDCLLPWRTVWKNVCLGLQIQHTYTEENIAYAKHLLQTYGLWEFKDKYPAQLSGGMRQRAALIRTLATKPSLLLLDEAFSALDYQTRLQVSGDVYRILKAEKKSVILVTHDISEAISLADRVICLSQRPGKIKSDIKILMEPGPMQRRADKKFSQYFTLLWKEASDHESGHDTL